MPNAFSDELRELERRLRSGAEAAADPSVGEPVTKLRAAAAEVGKSWSGSPIGYHAQVYYVGFRSPPAGAAWSSEWGDHPAFSGGSRGDWHQYTFDEVVEHIRERAGDPDLSKAEAKSEAARAEFGRARGEVVSILTAFLTERSDELITQIRAEAEKVLAGTQQQFAQATLPTGTIASRDSLAMSQGLTIAPHIALQAEAIALMAPFDACIELADLAARAASHIERLTEARRVTAALRGTAVFIGHGQSPLWRELKDFLQDRLGLAWEEFNRVPVAGVTNIARLAEMLDAAGVAFLVLTAEDEQSDGQVVARQNVVHEAGLFQGRLGFTRAILLLEEGCAEFSNIQGLGQIRFPPGNISAAFEQVRLVLEREGFLT